MGYYASCNGYVKTKEPINDDLTKELRCCFVDVYYNKETNELELSGNEKYHEDDVWIVLTEIENNTITGEIEFTGEDDAHWRFFFKDGHWEEESGRIIYESDESTAQKDKDEFLGRIIDVIQDCLDNPRSPVIEGDWYDRITDELSAIMRGWKVFT